MKNDQLNYIAHLLYVKNGGVWCWGILRRGAKDRWRREARKAIREWKAVEIEKEALREKH